MSIIEENKIDMVATYPDHVKLIMTDHLPWGQDDEEHMYIIQEKINSYFSFIETGQMAEEFPKIKTQKIKFEIVSKYQLNEVAKNFSSLLSKFFEETEVSFIWMQPKK